MPPIIRKRQPLDFAFARRCGRKLISAPHSPNHSKNPLQPQTDLVSPDKHPRRRRQMPQDARQWISGCDTAGNIKNACRAIVRSTHISYWRYQVARKSGERSSSLIFGWITGRSTEALQGFTRLEWKNRKKKLTSSSLMSIFRHH